MNRDTVIRLAREAGGTPYTNRHVDGSAFAFSAEKLDAFAALVDAEVRKEIEAAVLREREECAAICNNMAAQCDDPDKCADAIRARIQPAPTGAQED